MLTWRGRHAQHTTAGQRQLAQVQDRMRTLIRLANEFGEAGTREESTSPQDLMAVRSLRRAREAVLAAAREATVAGIDREVVRKRGIDSPLATAVVVSDLATYMVSEIRSQV